MIVLRYFGVIFENGSYSQLVIVKAIGIKKGQFLEVLLNFLFTLLDAYHYYTCSII